MEIYAAQPHQNKHLDKDLHAALGNTNDAKTDVASAQTGIVKNKQTTVTLSSEALALQNSDKADSSKTDEQKTKEYDIAKKAYHKEVNDLPVDYRKMKEVKDRIDEEIKTLKAEVSKLQQSTTLNEDEKEQAISALEQQIADKALMTLEISKKFIQKLEEQERSKQISTESATTMLKTFNASPPEFPVKTS
jgi:hypothetical protein